MPPPCRRFGRTVGAKRRNAGPAWLVSAAGQALGHGPCRSCWPRSFKMRIPRPAAPLLRPPAGDINRRLHTTHSAAYTSRRSPAQGAKAGRGARIMMPRRRRAVDSGNGGEGVGAVWRQKQARVRTSRGLRTAGGGGCPPRLPLQRVQEGEGGKRAAARPAAAPRSRPVRVRGRCVKCIGISSFLTIGGRRQQGQSCAGGTMPCTAS